MTNDDPQLVNSASPDDKEQMFATAPTHGFFKKPIHLGDSSRKSTINKKRQKLKKKMLNTTSKTVINEKSVIDDAEAYLRENGDTITNVEDELEQQLKGFKFSHR